MIRASLLGSYQASVGAYAAQPRVLPARQNPQQLLTRNACSVCEIEPLYNGGQQSKYERVRRGARVKRREEDSQVKHPAEHAMSHLP